jgi:hypothetical protein
MLWKYVWEGFKTEDERRKKKEERKKIITEAKHNIFLVHTPLINEGNFVKAFSIENAILKSQMKKMIVWIV